MYNRMPHNMGSRFGFFSSNAILSWLILILIVGLIIFVFYNISKNNSGKNESTKLSEKDISSYKSKKNKALDILDERYAKGEIDEDEYLRIKKNLN